MRIVRRALLVLLAALAVAIVAFVVWGNTPLGPTAEASAALQSDNHVQVVARPWLVFEPTNRQPDTGFIFYPGGRVDPRSYAPAARAIAAQGYLVVIVPMPLNLAVFGSGRAGDVAAAYPHVRHWALGGHSLGGAMAAAYVYSHPESVQGLVLWASYPAGNNSLAGRDDLRVVSIYGTRDGLNAGEFRASARLLPDDTHWVEIEGGNHAQFGWYGPQPGDNAATVSHEEQQQLAVSATVALLDALHEGAP